MMWPGQCLRMPSFWMLELGSEDLEGESGDLVLTSLY